MRELKLATLRGRHPMRASEVIDNLLRPTNVIARNAGRDKFEV